MEMNNEFSKWIEEVEELVLDEFGEDTWDVWEEDEYAWAELYESDYTPEEAIEEYKTCNA